MKPASRIVTPIIKWILRAICRVDSRALKNVPRRGPLIIVVNHINFLEVPLIYTHLFPRRASSIIKQETWDNPFLAFLAGIWDAIPLDRNSTDLGAMRKSLEALKLGRILLLAPEGTRSRDGKLRRGQAGIAQIALHSGAPIVPIAHFGGERFWANLKAFRRTRFCFRVGEPFVVRQLEGENPKEARLAIVGEIMNRISILLPEAYRGAYPNPQDSPSPHLDFTVR